MEVNETLVKKEMLDDFIVFLRKEHTEKEILEFIDKSVDFHYKDEEENLRAAMKAWAGGFFTGVEYMKRIYLSQINGKED